MFAAVTHFAFSRSPVNRTNLGRGIVCAPFWLWKVICFLLTVFEKICNRTWNFFHPLRFMVELHFVIFIPHFIRQTTSPGFDLIDCVLVLIVATFADVDFFVSWETSGSTFTEAGYEHDKASIHYLFYRMITVLSCFDHFVIIKMLIVPVDSLFWPVIPASIHEFVTLSILPRAVDLRYDRFCEVVLILNEDPVTYHN